MGRRSTIIFIDTFSGAAAELPRKKRTPECVLAALRRDPKISCFDFSEHPWLHRIVNELIKEKKISEVPDVQYPWHRFTVNDKDNKK